MESAMGKRSGAKLAVVIAAAVLLLLLLAAPAMAAPFATSLVASPSLSTVALGDSLTISATLTDTDNALPVGGETVRVEQATSDSGPWSLTDLVTTDVTTGVASYDVILTQTTYYRFVYAPEPVDTYSASTSNVLTVLVTPFATSLTASPSESTVNIGDSATISALLMDTANDLPVDGQVVRVEQATSNAGPWSLVNYADNGGASGQYSLEFYPAQTAYYRFVYEGTDTYSPSRATPSASWSRPSATSLTASPSQTTLNYGAGLTISAVLTETDGALPIGGAALRVESATSSGGPWSLVQTVTTDGMSGSSSLAVTPTHTMYYRFVFVGTDTYADGHEQRPHRRGHAPRYEPDRVARHDHGEVRRPSHDQRRADEYRRRSPHRWRSAAGGVGDEQRRTVVAGPDREQRRHDRRLQPRGRADADDVLPLRLRRHGHLRDGHERHPHRQGQARARHADLPSSVKKNKSFTVKATVKPGAPDGPAVKIQAYRKHDGKWSKYKSAYSTTRSGTTCSVKIKIKDTGNFKFRATVAASSKFVAVNSSYSKVMKVKK